MATLLEKRFWKLLCPSKTKCHLPGIVERIENVAHTGTPDINGSYKDTLTFCSVDYWIELKICDNKIKDRDPEKLCRDDQLIWHKKRLKNGAKIFIFVRYHDKFIVYRAHSISGKYCYYKKVGEYFKRGRSFDWISFESWFKVEVMK